MSSDSFKSLLNQLQDFEYAHPGQNPVQMAKLNPDNNPDKEKYWLAQIGYVLTNNYFSRYVEINSLLGLPYNSRRVNRAMKEYKQEYDSLEDIAEAMKNGKNWN